MKKAFFPLLLIIYTSHSFADQSCRVDKDSYSQYKKEQGQVPLENHTVVSLKTVDSQLRSIVISENEISCSKSSLNAAGRDLNKINNISEAKSLFFMTGEENFERFVDYNVLNICGDFMILTKGEKGYIAYMKNIFTHYDAVVSLVGINCKPEAPRGLNMDNYFWRRSL